MRAFAVVMLDVDPQDMFEMSAADDQEPVEALVADRADESLRVGVRLRRLHQRVDDRDSFAAEQLVEGGGELAVAVVDQEPRPFEDAGEAEIARLLSDPSAGRIGRAAGEVDAASSMKKSTYRRRSVTVSTVKKSQASMLAACRRRNARQLTALRRGAGSSPAEASRRRTVLGERRKSSLSSSPAIR